ncbi:MAG: hypothetical protein KAY21_05585 [Limnohabitans sp.]|nr:hypothetical protein [Limnohabitans sp.]
MSDLKIYPAGMIRYLGLSRWWMNDLSTDEQTLIESKFSPLGMGGLTHGEISVASDTPRQYLKALAGWFDVSHPNLAVRIRAKAAKVPDRRRPVRF